jgi:hypothetical protein
MSWLLWHWKRRAQDKLAMYERDANLPIAITEIVLTEEKKTLMKNSDAT